MNHRCFDSERADRLKEWSASLVAECNRLSDTNHKLELTIRWCCKQIQQLAGSPQGKPDWESVIWEMFNNNDFSREIVVREKKGKK
jgi:hypothetical protein